MKRNRQAVFAFMMVAAVTVFSAKVTEAQTPAGKSAPAQTKKGPAPASTMRVEANLVQLMRGTLYPASNVIFAVQDQDPTKITPAKDPATAPNPLESTYGQWQAVENSALAIAEVANLLTLPGRKCSNGIAVPIQNPDWPKLVQGLRDAGMTVYAAAKAKDQDKMVDVAGTLAEACANCHDKYREKPNLADRCK